MGLNETILLRQERGMRLHNQRMLLVINLWLALSVFLRFLFADNSISFDYQFYIQFFEEVSALDIRLFLERSLGSFPYFPWADSGKFEIGIAFVAFFLGKFLEPAVLYALIAAVSILIKLEIFRSFGLGLYKTLIFYVFDVVLFESNALRAGQF